MTFWFFVFIFLVTAVLILVEARVDCDPAHRAGYLAFILAWLFTAFSLAIFGDVVFVSASTILFGIVTEDCYLRRLNAAG